MDERAANKEMRGIILRLLPPPARAPLTPQKGELLSVPIPILCELFPKDIPTVSEAFPCLEVGKAGNKAWELCLFDWEAIGGR